MPVTVPVGLAGWEFEGPVPPEKKYVVLAVPHTSNWDGLLLVALTRKIGLEMSWMIKNDWFIGPMGSLLRGVGAVAIDRSAHTNMVDQMIAEFGKREQFVLVIPPEGTRRRTDTWKSGFYHIARGADVPVVPGYLDYGRKRAGLGKAIPMTGNVKEDMDAIRAFYKDKNPRPHTPANFGPIVLKDEA